MTQKANRHQIGAISALLNKLNIQDQKTNLVQSFSQGRTGSRGALYSSEANMLIAYLKKQDPEEAQAEKMRRKIIALAHEMGWHLKGTRRVDMEHLDAWCVKMGYLHKKLNQYRYAELPKLITQFEGVYKSFLKGI